MDEDYKIQLENKLNSLVNGFKEELSGIRANRPTPKLVEDIKVDYLGQKLPIKQLGSIGIAPPRCIQIIVWDKNAVASIAKAIEEAEIGAMPSIQDNVIRISLPPLTEERRRELIKLVKKIAENVRIKIRFLRDEYNKIVKKSELREDERFKRLEDIQETVDKANKKIEELLDNKIKEIQE